MLPSSTYWRNCEISVTSCLTFSVNVSSFQSSASYSSLSESTSSSSFESSAPYCPSLSDWKSSSSICLSYGACCWYWYSLMLVMLIAFYFDAVVDLVALVVAGIFVADLVVSVALLLLRLFHYHYSEHHFQFFFFALYSRLQIRKLFAVHCDMLLSTWVLSIFQAVMELTMSWWQVVTVFWFYLTRKVIRYIPLNIVIKYYCFGNLFATVHRRCKVNRRFCVQS